MGQAPMLNLCVPSPLIDNGEEYNMKSLVAVVAVLFLPLLAAGCLGETSPLKVTFASNRDGSYEIHKMNADGSNQTRLTNNQAIDEWPDWSP